MRVFHLADSHFNSRNPISNLDDCLAVFVENARKRKPQLIVHAGDFFERASNPVERLQCATFLLACADVAPVVGVRGNHDAPLDLDIFGLIGNGSNPVIVHSTPTVEEVNGFAVVCVPWFDKSFVVARMGAEEADIDSSKRAVEAEAARLLQWVTGECAAARARGLVPLVLMHALVQGSETETGQTLTGKGIEFTPHALLELGAAYVALGHVHKRQSWSNDSCIVAYAGSPARCNFGEPEPKGYFEINFAESGDALESTAVDLPATPLAMVEFPASEAGNAANLPDSVVGAVLRVRIRGTAEELSTLDPAALREGYLKAGAAHVKIETIVEESTRVRSEAIARATTTRERVAAFWEATGIELNDDTRAGVLAKLEEIEQLGGGPDAFAQS